VVVKVKVAFTMEELKASISKFHGRYVEVRVEYDVRASSIVATVKPEGDFLPLVIEPVNLFCPAWQTSNGLVAEVESLQHLLVAVERNVRDMSVRVCALINALKDLAKAEVKQ